MRNVDRLEEPKVLKRNAPCWTRQLLDAIDKARGDIRKVPRYLRSRYSHEEVREHLKKMYSGLCCYCESRIGHVATENIEHRKPQRHFPKSTFSWDNLHLACPKCNGAKSDKWNSDHEILDAVNDRPISKHLGYEVGLMVTREPRTDRGVITVKHADLNRHVLLQTRQRVFSAAWDTVMKIREMEKVQGDSPIVTYAKSELREKFSDEHGSLIEYVASRVLNSIA